MPAYVQPVYPPPYETRASSVIQTLLYRSDQAEAPPQPSSIVGSSQHSQLHCYCFVRASLTAISSLTRSDSETPRLAKIVHAGISGLSREERCSSTCHLSNGSMRSLSKGRTFNLDLNEFFFTSCACRQRQGRVETLRFCNRNRDTIDHTNRSCFALAFVRNV